MPNDDEQRPGAGVVRSETGPLHSERGSTSISDTVVGKVVSIAASEVPGVHALGGGTARAVGSLTRRVGIGDSRTQGVTVEVGETEVAADLLVVIEYGESIPELAGGSARTSSNGSAGSRAFA